MADEVRYRTVRCASAHGDPAATKRRKRAANCLLPRAEPLLMHVLCMLELRRIGRLSPQPEAATLRGRALPDAVSQARSVT